MMQNIRKTILLILLCSTALLIGCQGKKVTEKEVNSENEVNSEKEVNSEDQVELTDHQKAWMIDIDGQMREALSKAAGITEKMTDEERNARLDLIIDGIKNEKWNDDRVYNEIRKLISDFGIGHMRISRSLEYASEDNRGYLISGQWFGEDYYILAVQEGNEQALGCKLTAIENIPLEEILARYDTIYSTETRNNLKDYFEKESRMGFSEVELQYLGIKEADRTEATFTFEKDNGEKFDLVVPVVSLVASSNVAIVSIWDKTRLPFGEKVYEESGHAPFTYVIDADNKAVYYQYNECNDPSSSDEYSGYPYFADFMDEMISDMKAHEKEWDCFVMDLRNNEGGSEVLWNDALRKYKDYLNEFPVKILIGKTTFSAANGAIDRTLYELDDVELYGEETGLAVHNYTQVKITILERTGCELKTTEHEDFSYVLTDRAEDTSKGVLPDVEIIQTFDNYLLGIDDVYLNAVKKSEK